MEKLLCHIVIKIKDNEGPPNDYHIDVFATAIRGGAIDNLGLTKTDGTKSVNNSSVETIVTTLPDAFIQSPSESISYGKYFKTKEELILYKVNLDNSPNDSTKASYPVTKVYYGPGGNYLSNEIFYRVARLRAKYNPTIPTGHFHISKLQNPYISEDFSISKTQQLLSIVQTTINKGVTGL